MNPTNEQELDEQLSVMIERDAMALCCNDCGGGGYDYDNTKTCDTCKGTGLTEWQNDYLIGQIIKLIQAYTNAEIAKAKLEAFDVAFDCHDYDRLRAYRAELLKEVK